MRLQDLDLIRQAFVQEAHGILHRLGDRIPLIEDDPGQADALAELRAGFHRLKGSAATCGIPFVSDLAAVAQASLDRALAAGRAEATEVEMWGAFLAEIHAQLERVEDWLDQAGDAPSPPWVLLVSPLAGLRPPLAEAGPGSTPVFQVADPAAPWEQASDRCAGIVLDLDSAPVRSDVLRWVAVAEARSLPLVGLANRLEPAFRADLVDVGIERVLPRDTGLPQVLWTLKADGRLALAAPSLALLLTPDPLLAEQVRADLAEAGFRTRVASTLENLAQSETPDVILVHASPTGSCTDQVRAVRSLAHLALRPLLLLHSVTSLPTRQEALASGADDWIGLPWLADEAVHRVRDHVELRQLKAELRRRDRQAVRPMPTAQARPAPRPSARPRILVAEDDVTVRSLVSFYLGREGWEVVEAEDGQRARDLLAKERFDLALLDIFMPLHTGFDLLKWLATQDRRPRHVVMLTAQNPEENLPRAFEMGAVDFISKPFAPEVMVSRLKRLVVQA